VYEFLAHSAGLNYNTNISNSNTSSTSTSSNAGDDDEVTSSRWSGGLPTGYPRIATVLWTRG